MKEHKTFNQQLTILRNRGVVVPTNGKPKRFLEQENYYNVINGYKDLFLVKGSNNQPVEPEIYQEGTHFNELKALFLFDRELRILLLKYLLIFENSIKTTVAYEFSKKYPRKNAYLDIANFVDNDPKKVLQQISILTKTIHDKVDRSGAIKHYIEEHGEVPLWVLVNFLTMGNIANFYNILTDSTKNIIAKFYTDKYRAQNKDNTFRLSSADLSACLKVANLVRNICAHDERLYNVNLRNVRISQIANHFGIRRYDNKRFIVLILFLKIVLDKKDFQRLYKALRNLFNQYADEFKTVVFEDILKTMGIDLTEMEKLA
ncbi:Abi family protein [Streptococcus sp. FSL W8-0197]|uniref:Abi family protein n=1 Tax=Streptococcus TaxID=1301 RepID=UPI0001F89897|nr:MULTISPECIES: Abi family protein [Streptococcus]EFX56600.1 Abi-like protein [Streptococcus sp. C300]MCM3309355.1 Abi family protein [Streptococcus oralis]MCY7061614.1 Abi family protein [Streptococcus oralis]